MPWVELDSVAAITATETNRVNDNVLRLTTRGHTALTKALFYVVTGTMTGGWTCKINHKYPGNADTIDEIATGTCTDTSNVAMAFSAPFDNANMLIPLYDLYVNWTEDTAGTITSKCYLLVPD